MDQIEVSRYLIVPIMHKLLWALNSAHIGETHLVGNTEGSLCDPVETEGKPEAAI